MRQGVGCPAESTHQYSSNRVVGWIRTDEPWNYPETKRSLSKEGGRSLRYALQR